MPNTIEVQFKKAWRGYAAGDKAQLTEQRVGELEKTGHVSTGSVSNKSGEPKIEKPKRTYRKRRTLDQAEKDG